MGGNEMLLEPVTLERWHGYPEPMGTFAYLLSVSGARRLLLEGLIFPLDFQLDAQLNYAFASGSLCAYRCNDAGCLFYSSPCQFIDSDVQACWSADHDLNFRMFKEGFLLRIRELDHRGCEALRRKSDVSLELGSKFGRVVARAQLS